MGCSEAAPTSGLTDFGIEGESAIPTLLLWKDAQYLKRGTCDTQKPLLRRYCSHSQQQVDWNEVVATLSSDRPEKLANLRRDSAELRGQLEAIDRELENDPTNLSLTRERAMVLESLLKLTVTEIELQKQIQDVEGFLQRVSNQDIVHTLQNESESFTQDKNFLAQIDRLFGGVSTPPPPTIPPEQPSLELFFKMINPANSSCPCIMHRVTLPPNALVILSLLETGKFLHSRTSTQARGMRSTMHLRDSCLHKW